MAKPLKRPCGAPISLDELADIHEMIDVGKGDAAIAASIGATKPHGSRRPTIQQIADIRADWTGS